MAQARAIVFDLGGTLWYHPPGVFDDDGGARGESARRISTLLAPYGVGADGALAVQNELWDAYSGSIEDDPSVEPDGAAILEGILLARRLPPDRAFAG